MSYDNDVNTKAQMDDLYTEKVRKIKDVSAVIEETLLSEQKKLEELNQLKEKLNQLEAAKTEELEKIKYERQQIEEMRCQEAESLKLLLKTKTEEKNREIAEAKEQLGQEAEAYKRELKATFEKTKAARDHALRNKIEERLTYYQRATQTDLTTIRDNLASLNQSFDSFFKDFSTELYHVMDAEAPLFAEGEPTSNIVSFDATRSNEPEENVSPEDRDALNDLLRLQEDRLKKLNDLRP